MALRFLPNANVPNYGAAPASGSGADILRRLEGRKTVSSPQTLPPLYMGAKTGGQNQIQTAGPEETDYMIDQLGSEEPQKPDQITPAISQGVSAGISAGLGGLFSGSSAAAAPAGYEAIGTLATGGEMLGLAGTAAPPIGGGFMAAAAPVAAAPLAALTAYNTITGVGNALKGDDLSFAEETALALPTFGLSYAYDPIKDALGFTSGKDADQKERDGLRRQLQQEGLLSDSYDLTLSDGTPFNIGGDGSIRSYEVQNPDDPITGRVVGAAQVVAALYTGKPGNKQTTDLTGWLTNAALSNAGGSYEAAMQNLVSQFSRIAEARGLNPETTRAILKDWKDKGVIDDQTYQAYAAAHESFVDGNPWQFDDETAKQPATPEGSNVSKMLMYSNKTPPAGAPKPTQSSSTSGQWQQLPQQQLRDTPLKEVERFWQKTPRVTQLTAYGSSKRRNPV